MSVLFPGIPTLAALDRTQAMVFQLLPPEEAISLSRIVKRYPFTERASTYGPRKVIQYFRACEEAEVPHESPARQISSVFGQWMNEALGAFCRRHRFSEPFHPPLIFNDHLILWYPEGETGLGVHRDLSKYKNLIVSLTLCGSAKFNLHDEPAMPASRSFSVGPGQVVVMCAPGFKGGNVRPYHSVTDVSEERIAVIFKQKGG